MTSPHDDFTSVETAIINKYPQVVSVTFAAGPSGLQGLIEMEDGLQHICNLPWKDIAHKCIPYESIVIRLENLIRLIISG